MIYKRAQNTGRIENEMKHANFWMFNLEEALLKITTDKIHLFDL